MEEVGRGNYSVVYKGRKKKSIEYVAVKSVERGRRKKLMDEVAIFQQIQNDHISLQQNNNQSSSAPSNWHPNILKFYNWYETRNHFWIILEYCSGGDLFSLLEQDKKLPEETVKKFAYEILEGLSYLHSQGIIFGDLKPSNVLLNEYCKLKLCDFGLAKKVTDLSNLSNKSSAEDRTSSHSQANSCSKNKAGTPYYMAPELFDNNGVYSYYSDFWSLGCILVEMATGKPPFYTNSLQELLLQIQNKEVQVQSKFSDEFNDLIKKMLEKDPVVRINWDEIKSHPWWQTPVKTQAPAGNENKFFDKMKDMTYSFTNRLYQPQLQFDKYLQGVRGIDPGSYHQLRNRQMTKQILGEGGPSIDAMRISYNVKKNMAKEDEKNNGYSRGANAISQPLKQKNQTKRIDDYPIAVAPGSGVQASDNDDFNQYNSNVQNRNSKLKYEDDLEDEEQSNPKQDIDFYKKEVKETGSNQKVGQFDYNLGKNTKLVVDFTQEKEEEKQQLTLPPTQVKPQPVNKPSSPLPNKAPQPVPIAATRTNPNVVKQNNFFSSTENKNFKKISPSPSKNIQQRNAPLQGSNIGNFKAQTQQLFQNRTLGGNDKEDRKISPMAQKVTTSTASKKLEKKTTLPSAIDRFQFLNDQFDNFELFGEDNENNNNNDLEREVIQPKNPIESSDKDLWDYHKPMDYEQTQTTFRLLKDMTLFNSPLSMAQIKSEIQTLVTQTVQIGPVQNQNSSQANSALSGGGSFSSSLTRGDSSRVGQDQNISQSTMASSQPTQMKVPHKTIEQLIIHNSDTAVKPIVGNKEIERIQESTYNFQHLKFVPWTSDEVIAKINTSQIESHLSDVYTSIASNTTINEKISTLQYFESIIVNSNVSNQLINSVFMALLKKMLEQIKSPMIKIRVCSVVGLLIRHSTIIDNELAEIDIASQLIDTLRDSNEKVRRRAIAALGEYMFYAATQLDDEMADPVWELSDDAIDIIVQSLDEQEPDHIVRFYACKTLENICAQSTSAGHRFANLKTVQKVLNIFMMEVNEQEQDSQDDDQQPYLQWYEGIRISAAIALSHICKLNPQLFPVIFEAISPSRFCDTLMHGNGQSRVQQAFITMLNLALHNIYYPQISSILLKEKEFLKALMRLLEHQHIVIRGKCILTFLLLIKLDFRWMTAIQQEIKFFNELDKILKDNYKYVQCCLLCLADGIQEIVPTIFKSISEKLFAYIEFSKNQRGGSLESDDNDPTNLEFQINQSGNNEYGDFSNIKTSQLYHITILLDLQINPLIRSRLLSTPMIQAISTLLDSCDVNSFKGADQFILALLMMAENLSSNYKALTILAQPILTLLLPVLYDKMTNSKSDDIKFQSFKIFTDIMIQYINDNQVFNPHQIQIQQPQEFIDMKSTELILSIIQSQIFPKIHHILTEAQDPIPMFGLKLLNSIVDKNSNQIIAKLKRVCNIEEILASFYQVNHPKLNRHTINLVRKFIETKQLSTIQLKDLEFLKKTTLIISSMIQNFWEQTLELMLDILHDLLSQFNDLVKQSQEEQIVFHIDQIFDNFESCVKLLSTEYDLSLVEKASQCLILMLQLYAQSRLREREIYFVEGHFVYLLSAAQCEKQIIQKRILKCIYWALIQSEYQIQLSPEVLGQLDVQITQMLNSDDKSINSTSREIKKIIGQQMY